MKRIRRFIAGIVSGLSLAVLLGGAASPAAAAGKLTIYVDDIPSNNGSIKCPADAYPTIEGGMTAIGSVRTNVTLYICPGDYHPVSGLPFTDFTNLQIIGKGGPIIHVPNEFASSLFYIYNSTKVTIQGLNIDGGGNLNTVSVGHIVAIAFVNTTGTIQGNTVARWRQDLSGSIPVTTGTTAIAIADAAPYMSANVTIKQNTIYDSQEIGIYANENGAPKILKNRIVFSSNINPAFSYGSNPTHIQAGIMLLFAGPGAVVSGNQIESNADLYPQSQRSRGITLYSTSRAKVTGNTIRGTANQITIESYCDWDLNPNANNNTISGNKIYDTYYYSIRIIADDIGTSCANPHADFNKITGNKIYTARVGSSFPFGVYLQMPDGGVIDSNQVTKNTIAGFMYGLAIMPGASTNTVITGNKILSAPPAGVLASTPVTSPGPGEGPGPLPAWLLDFSAP